MRVDCASIGSKNILKYSSQKLQKKLLQMALCEQSHTRCCKPRSYSRAAEATRELDRTQSSSKRTDDSSLLYGMTTAVFILYLLRQYVLNENTRTALSHGSRCRPRGASKHSPGFARNIPPGCIFFFSFLFFEPKILINLFFAYLYFYLII